MVDKDKATGQKSVSGRQAGKLQNAQLETWRSRSPAALFISPMTSGQVHLPRPSMDTHLESDILAS